jgi:hypothetical protein
VTFIRCPVCKGLRGVQQRHAERSANVACQDCRRGNVVLRSRFHNYWLQRFTRDEIHEMAGAIWGE